MVTFNLKRGLEEIIEGGGGGVEIFGNGNRGIQFSILQFGNGKRGVQFSILQIREEA